MVIGEIPGWLTDLAAVCLALSAIGAFIWTVVKLVGRIIKQARDEFADAVDERVRPIVREEIRRLINGQLDRIEERFIVIEKREQFILEARNLSRRVADELDDLREMVERHNAKADATFRRHDDLIERAMPLLEQAEQRGREVG